MIKKIKQFLKLEPQFVYKGIRFFDFQSVKNFEVLLSNVADEAVKKYLIREIQVEVSSIHQLTPEMERKYQEKIDSIERFGKVLN